MRLQYLRIVSGLVVLAAPTLAAAQAVPRGEAARGVTVQDRARADYDPLGVRLGAFRLAAAATAGLGWDSNILGTTTNKISDGFGTLGADASLFSDWTTHQIGVTGRIEQRSYVNESAQDWTDYAIAAVGRYDFTPDTSLEGRLSRSQEHLEASSLDVQEAGISRPVPYAVTDAGAVLTSRFNRIGVLALANWRSYRFDDVDAGPPPSPGAAAPGDVSVNDFDSAVAALGLNYEIGPGRYVNLIGRYQDVTYRDSSQSGRDSQTWEALLGFTYDFDGVWAFRIAAGYRERTYSDPQIKTLSAPAIEGVVFWQPTQLTTVTFNLRQSIEESIRANAVSYTRTLGQVRVDHEYLRNVILSAEVAADRRVYEQPSEQATDGILILSARWLINRNFALVASYQYVKRFEATGGFEEYDRNLFQLRLRAAL